MLCFPRPPFHFTQITTKLSTTTSISAAPDPSPSPSPSPTPTYSTATTTTSDDATTASQKESKINFTPPLIAMVVVIITAFLLITYSRLISKHVATPILNRLRHWRRRRRRRTSHVASSSAGDLESFHQPNPNFSDSADQYHTFSPYGLDDSVIKTIPLSIYNSNQQSFTKQSSVKVDVSSKDCAVCLLEFEENDYVRTLPICSHAFHVDCIDIWLRSHANCPLCRARILLRSESQSQYLSSPFVPLMAGRIRPSLDGILDSILLEPLDEIQSENNDDSESQTQTPERGISGIAPEQEDQTFDFIDRRNLLLKRSYSFGFERSFQQPMTSPWRRSTTAASFWNKPRLSVSSPFSALTKSRVSSFRSTRLTKSPFFARRGRGLGLFPFSESSSLAASLSRRRSRSMASTPAAGFSSSRLRCGDPEALLSPERCNKR